MKIVLQTITLDEIREMAAHLYGDMVKAVVDIEKKILAVDSDLHADLEALLIENGFKQKDLWGINLYPDAPAEEFVEFDSMINVRPSQGNRCRGIEDAGIRQKILDVVSKTVLR